MAISASDYQLVDADRYYNMGWSWSTRRRQQIERRIYEAFIPDTDTSIPPQPINPGNLQSPWFCQDCHYTSPRATPLGRVVQETWVYEHPWEDDPNYNPTSSTTSTED